MTFRRLQKRFVIHLCIVHDLFVIRIIWFLVVKRLHFLRLRFWNFISSCSWFSETPGLLENAYRLCYDIKQHGNLKKCPKKSLLKRTRQFPHDQYAKDNANWENWCFGALYQEKLCFRDINFFLRTPIY